MVVFYRIFEPDRPNHHKDLPAYNGADYWHSMSRTVDIKSANLVEVRQYPDQIRRVVTFFLFLLVVVTFFMAIYNTFGSFSNFVDEFGDDYEYVFDFENKIKKMYQEDSFIDDRFREIYPEDKFIASFMNNPIHSYRFWSSMFPLNILFLTGALALLYLAFFTPRACPVRFDRKHEIAYTWYKKKLWIADIGPFLRGMQARLAPEQDGHPVYGHDTSVGSLAIRMFCADNPEETREFKIGTYPVCHAHQSFDLLMFLQAFMSKYLYEPGDEPELVRRREWNADWLKKVKRGRFFLYDPVRWLGQQSFIRHDFDEAATEEAIMCYLTTPTTPDRGKPRN